MTARLGGSKHTAPTVGSGDNPTNCSTLYPDPMPWKKTACVEEEDLPVGGVGFDVGLVEAVIPPPGSWKRDAHIPLSSWTVPLANKFEALTEDVEIGAVQTDTNLKEARRGMITVDTGAAESVLAKNLLPNEPTVEGDTKRRGVKCVAANGWNMDDMGEKRVKFERTGSNAVNSITVQVTDVSNVVIFSKSRTSRTQRQTEDSDEKHFGDRRGVLAARSP